MVAECHCSYDTEKSKIRIVWIWGPISSLCHHGYLSLLLRSAKLEGFPLGHCFSNCGPRPPATGTPGVLAKMQIPGLQLRSAGSEFLGVGFGYLYFKQAF